MIHSLQTWNRLLWRRLARLAQVRPVWSAGVVVVMLLLGSGLLGYLMQTWEDSLVKWLDNAFIVLAGVSLTVGWALALIVFARRQEAALSFRHAGERLDCPRFEAALILASRNEPLMDWHLRHIPHQRVEFVWTDFTRQATACVLQRFPALTCLHGPDRPAEESLADPFDLASVKRDCLALLQEILARHPRDQVCVDITGGTAIMSLAAFQAAEELGVTSLYLLGIHCGPTGQPTIRAERVSAREEGQIKLVADHRNPDGAADSTPETEAPR